MCARAGRPVESLLSERRESNLSSCHDACTDLCSVYAVGTIELK